MATSNSSFDIVSRVDEHELGNAINQARKEIDNRYDFKGTGSRIETIETGVVIYSSNDFHLNAIKEVLESKLIKRNVPIKAFDWKPIDKGPKGSVKIEAAVLRGIDKDKGREIIKFVKSLDKKINISMQDDQLRVTAKSKDSLQNIMKSLREKDLGIPLQFTNYR